MAQTIPAKSQMHAVALEQRSPNGSHPADRAGHAIVARLQEAASISNENCDRAMTLAHNLSVRLRGAEDRIAQLQKEVEDLQSRAARAERWLDTIKREIEDNLIASMEANRPEPPVVH